MSAPALVPQEFSPFSCSVSLAHSFKTVAGGVGPRKLLSLKALRDSCS